MFLSSFFSGIRTQFHTFWKRHSGILTILFVLSLIAGTSQYLLKAQLVTIETPTSTQNTLSDAQEDPRACSSANTPFDNMLDLQEVMNLFTAKMSDIVEEREKFLSKPSEWKCVPDEDGNKEPPMEKLQSLARSLPALRNKPVTFASFSSIVSEFERAYECKLSEFQDYNVLMVGMNRDIQPKPAEFCCATSGTNSECVQKISSVTCDAGTITDDPSCNNKCAVTLTMSQLALRLEPYNTKMTMERQRARIAVERTLLALRSFELQYASAKQLSCFARASLDLKNELSLLADTTSCFPRALNAVTSGHNRNR